jgi:hypothetical protein
MAHTDFKMAAHAHEPTAHGPLTAQKITGSQGGTHKHTLHPWPAATGKAQFIPAAQNNEKRKNAGRGTSLQHTHF